MKVIKRVETKKIAPWSRRVLCGDCKSTLEVEESDLYRDEQRRPGDPTDGWDDVRFDCPVCLLSNRVPDSSIPPAVRNRIRKASPEVKKAGECEVLAMRGVS